jgi:hypothetical protein
VRANRDLTGWGRYELPTSWLSVRDANFEVLVVRVCAVELVQLVAPAVVVGEVVRVALEGQVGEALGARVG